MADRSHWHNEQEKASGVLDDVLEAAAGVDVEAIANQSAVEHELAKESFLRPEDSGRTKSRVLYITDDETVLRAQSQSQTFLLEAAAAFAELHIVVTAPLAVSKELSERLSSNVWLYTTGHANWWQVPRALHRIAVDQLSFGGGFRADLIVVSNPFEAAFGAYRLAQTYERVLQVHVPEAYWSPRFKKASKANWWRSHIAHFVLKRTRSIMAQTSELKTYLEHTFPQATVGELPRFRNLKGLLSGTAENEVPALFTQYVLRLLFVGELNEKSTLYKSIDAARQALQNKSIALIVVGDGSHKSEFLKRAKILGIDTQVLFKPATTQLTQYFSNCDIMLVTDTTEASDELVIKAAAAGVPLVMTETALRNELFEDGKDAFLCEPTDSIELTQKLNKLIGDKALRSQFTERGKFMVQNRLNEDPENFPKAFAAVLESAYAAYVEA